METSQRKKNIIFITALSVIGLVGAMALQVIWISSSYKLIRNELLRESYEAFRKALNEEINIVCNQIPADTEIMADLESDSVPQITYLCEGIRELGIELSIYRIDSLVSLLLKDKDIHNRHYVNLIDIRKDSILQSTAMGPTDTNSKLKSRVIPVRADLSQGIQLTLQNPYTYVFKRMGLLLAGTFIIMLLVIICIGYQVRFISRFEKIFQIREDFSYALIHDMKTPLTSIIMALKFLRSGKLDSKPDIKKNYFDIAENEADHLLTLTNKVLTISKLENHKLEMNRTELLLNPMIEKLTEKFKLKSQKPVEFIVDLQTDTVYADAEYLEEALSNLIDNSIKYSREKVRIGISAARDDRYTILKIHDNGLGISEKDIHLIFLKFERTSAVKRNRKNGISGFGLGLNFVDQVVKAHQGKIFVTSIEGEFTEFSIYLPHPVLKDNA